MEEGETRGIAGFKGRLPSQAVDFQAVSEAAGAIAGTHEHETGDQTPPGKQV
jgi:hypothetical protein